MKTTALSGLAVLTLLVASCSTAEKPIKLADLHPAKPNHATYDSSRNMTIIGNDDFSVAMPGNVTNVMIYPEGSPLPISPKRFELLYQINNPKTAVAVEYLGQKEGYAYLRLRSIPIDHPNKASNKIVYATLTNLDQSFLDALPAKGSAQ